MASIVQTTTKSPSDPWLHNNKTNVCYTEGVFNQNILPYWSFIESTPGFQDLVFEVNGDTRVTIISYDTADHANTAFLSLYGEGQSQESINYRLAGREMIKQLNVNYTFNTVINY